MYLRPRFHAPLAALLAAVLLLASTPAGARPAEPPATGRLIVKLRDAAPGGSLAGVGPEAAAGQLSALAGAELDVIGAAGEPGAFVLGLPEGATAAEADALAARLAARPEVEYAHPDTLLFPGRVPADPRYAELWGLAPVATSGTITYGANLPDAWTITTGSASIVTAIVDTGGLLAHEDLVGRTPAGNVGYDMVSDTLRSNDGGGRDDDPADPGDWVDESETDDATDPLVVAQCSQGYASNSSWHGSHVAGTIGASANNGRGVVGVNWSSKLLHLRSLGKCGGFLSDSADAVRWAAGLPVAGAPLNPNPARVINMSLGGPGECAPYMQSAINAAVAAGAVVVVAAGNESSNLDLPGFDANPAECDNVITVGATNRRGNRAFYSNYGGTVEISAPGGDIFGSILSTVNEGTQGPTKDGYASYDGTSMATPHVAGVVSLMLSVNPALTSAQVLQILQSTATAFPAGSTCNTSICGAGILNAGRAVEEAARLVRTVGWSVTGQTVNEGAGEARIRVALSVPSNRQIAVPYTVTGTADGGDHTLAAGTLSFAPGATTATLSFAIDDDAQPEANETVVVRLGTPAGSPQPAALAGAEHVLTILDNEAGAPAAALAIADPQAFEFSDRVVLEFTVQRSGPAGAVGATYLIGGVGNGGLVTPAAEGEVALGAAENSKRFSVSVDRTALGLVGELDLTLVAPTGGALVGTPASLRVGLSPVLRTYLPLTVR
jgi:serine protease